MNPRTQCSWALTGAWIALTAVAGAQAPCHSTGQPPPRVPGAFPSSPVASLVAEPAVTLDPLAVRPPDTGARAVRPEREPQGVVSRPMSDARWSRVHWDTAEDGTIWVRGRNYKASFGAEGAIYYPLFGSDQPRHFPLALSLASATSDGRPIPLAPVRGAVRDGARVVIDRGAIDEVYEIGAESMEQTFVVEQRVPGDLTLSVRLDTELARAPADGGFEFSNELGGVRYSRAFARLADGGKLPLTTRPIGSGVQIEMSAEDVAASPVPLVVDPVVSTFDVDATSYDDFDPDMAYDATTNRYLYVYGERATASDYDVYSELISATGTVLDGVYVNLSTEDMYDTAVGNLNAYDQFMVAMTDSTRVVGRTTSATGIAYGTQFLIHSGGHPRNVSVGGDPYGTAPAYYCVVWDRSVVTGADIELDVIARLVTNTGGLLGPGPLPLATSTAAEFDARVSKGNNSIQWNVVWSRGPALPPGGGAVIPEDVMGAQILWDGTAIPTPAFAIAATPGVQEALPSVSSPNSSGEYLVAWAHEFGTDYDIFAARVLGGSVLSTVSLTGIESDYAGNLFDNQTESAIETDGDRFVLTYRERPTVPFALPRIHMASFALLPGEVRCLEPHIPLSTPGVDSRDPAVVSTSASGGAQHRFALGWTEELGANAHDIEGAFFDVSTMSTYCYGDGTGIACPCGNAGGAGRGCANSVSPSGAVLTAVGDPDVSADTAQLRALGMPNATTCLFFQGTTSGPNGGLGASFGDGLRCTGGTTVRLGTKTTALGIGIFPQTGDPSISTRGMVPAAGGVRFYQSWYRNAAVFCTASTFNLTNGARIVWLP